MHSDKEFYTKKDWFGNLHCENTAYWISSDGDLMTKLQNRATFFTNRLDFLVPIFFKTIKTFSSTFQGKFPIFKADWKIKHFSRQHSNSSTFQGLWEPWLYIYIKKNETKTKQIQSIFESLYENIQNLFYICVFPVSKHVKQTKLQHNTSHTHFNLSTSHLW